MLRVLGSSGGSLRAATRSWQRCFGSTCRLRESDKAPLGLAYDKLTVGIPKEDYPLEKRVAATPESVARLVKPGLTVVVEKGAGDLSYFSDADYTLAGAKVVDNVWKESDIVLKVSWNVGGSFD